MLSAGWSSLVARRAHNPKVAGSNPAPATVSQLHSFLTVLRKVWIDEYFLNLVKFLRRNASFTKKALPLNTLEKTADLACESLFDP